VRIAISPDGLNPYILGVLLIARKNVFASLGATSALGRRCRGAGAWTSGSDTFELWEESFELWEESFELWEESFELWEESFELGDKSFIDSTAPVRVETREVNPSIYLGLYKLSK
jgi:hypothetical protein